MSSGNVNSVDKISDYAYYTINLPLKEKMVSCPLMNDEGLVVALAQKASGQDTATICYGVDARFANSQEITAISYNDYALKQIGIKKALPETEDQALIFLYMISSQVDAEQYASLLNDGSCRFVYRELYQNGFDYIAVKMHLSRATLFRMQDKVLEKMMGNKRKSEMV